MKFVCPSCKAKYQIADERVTGRSAKMKCRKCDAVIRISLDGVELVRVTSALGNRPESEASSASGAKRPAKSAPSHQAPQERANPPVHSPGALPPPPSPPAAVSASPTPTPLPPVVSKSPAAAPPPPRRGQPGQPPLSAPFQESGPRLGLGAGLRAVSAARPAVDRGALPSAAPRITDASAPSAPVATGSLGREVGFDNDDEEEDEQTRIAPGLDALSGLGGLAGAFQLAVSAPAASALEALNMPADDWYVGINGVPAGPMRLNELRSKAATGAVDGESLVWRDGFEDWKPLKEFPELLAIIEDVLPRPSQVAASVAVAPLGQISDPFADRGAGASPPGAFDLEVAGIPKRLGPSSAAWLAIVAAMGLGFTVSYVVFSNPKKETVYVEVERPGAAASAAPDRAQAQPVNDEASDSTSTEASEQPKSRGGSRREGAVTTKPATSPESESKGGGLKGLAGLQGVSGPKGPSGEAAARVGGQPLDSAQVQRTVSRYTASVKRSCWQPALDTRDKNAPSSARVLVTIRVSPSGSVQSVSTSGDPNGYRGLSSCIAARVRGWQFPASSGTTTVNVPFVFAAQ